MMNHDGLLKLQEAVEYGEQEVGTIRQARNFICALSASIRQEAPDLADRIINFAPEPEE